MTGIFPSLAGFAPRFRGSRGQSRGGHYSYGPRMDAGPNGGL